MNPASLPLTLSENDEISELIELLHRTEQRLHELTAGEVDTVANRQGRTLLLSHAQEHRRQHEAARQASIINAMPMHIALLDTRGIVVSVNDAWRAFADSNCMSDDGWGVGVSYLSVCDAACGADADGAQDVATGIRAVLRGERDRFAMEYLCHAPDQQRRFLMTVTPLPGDPPTGVVVVHVNLSERMQAEEAQRALRLLLTDVVENMPTAVQLKSVKDDFRILMWNKAAETMFGVPRNAAIGLNVHDLWPGEEGEHMYAADVELASAGTTQDFPDRVISRREGGTIHAHVRKVGLRDESGTLSHILVIADDMTVQRAAQAQLLESEQRFRSLTELSSDWYWEQDAEYRFVSFSGGEAARKWGGDQFNTRGLRRWELAGVMPIIGSWDEHKAVLEAREPFRDFEYHRTLEDGTTQFVSTSGQPVFDAEGRFIGYRGVATDITQRKRVTQSLRESERRFSDLLKNVELLSVMLDRSGCIIYCNDYLLRLTGWKLKEVIGRDWFETFMPAELGDMKPVFAALLENKSEAWHRDNEILTRSRERRLIRWNNSVLRSPTGEVIGTASIGHDITDHKIAEARIIHLNRVYAMLSGINSLIVRVTDRDRLFMEACQIAVKAGGFRMAMLGIINQATGQFVSTASAGFDHELLFAINAVLSSKDTAMTTVAGRAIAEKRIIVSRDLQGDPQVLFGEKYEQCGVRSAAVLPLIVSGKAVGVFVLYAAEAEFFHDEEIALLTELANDISFAIDHLDKQARLNYLAYYDVLTGLANRSLFLERIAQYTITADSRGHKLALFLVDIERFKNINDSLGRVAGDSLLRQVAAWLIANAGDAYLMARVGGDQFALVLPEIRHDSGVIQLLKKKMDAFLKHPFQLNGTVFRVAFRVGVAMFPDDGVDADTLLKNAEAALKEAKARGERYLYYTSTMTEKVAVRLTLENQLRSALENGEFVLHYQPKLNLSTGKICGAEALIRWNDPRTGLVPPGLFIPVLEQTGLIHDVGRWAIRQAIEDYLRWCDLGTAALRIAVNVSPLQLRYGDFVEEIRQAVSVDLRARDGLELEITENVIMQDVNQSIKRLGALRTMGVRVAIDDFGTGFSSLSYLSRLPADILKIDRSFVVDMTTGAQGLALVATIINLAHALNLNVVAEGVETDEQRRLLRLLNCDEMQGFLFSAAVPVEDFEARFLTSGSYL